MRILRLLQKVDNIKATTEILLQYFLNLYIFDVKINGNSNKGYDIPHRIHAYRK